MTRATGGGDPEVMARKPRWTARGQWHHVTNRGVAGGEIFRDDTDRAGFLERVFEAHERWGTRVHAYCLMSNHFHFLIEDPEGELSRAIRHITGSHTQLFNLRHDRDGPLFKGRFHSRVVTDEAYLVLAMRYIHRNPMEAGLVRRAGDWPWSSHRYYVRDAAPAWLATRALMARFNFDPGRLDRFVHAPDAETSRPDGLVGVETGIEITATGDAGRSEGRRRWPVTVIVEAVAEALKLGLDEVLRGRRGQANVGREVAIVLWAEVGAEDRTAASGFFDVTEGSLTSLVSRYRRHLRDDATFRDATERVRAALRARGQEPT